MVNRKAWNNFKNEQKRQKILSYVFAGGGSGMGMDQGIDAKKPVGEIRVSWALQFSKGKH